MLKSLSILIVGLFCVCALFSACENNTDSTSSDNNNSDSSQATSSVSKVLASPVEQPQVSVEI